MTDPAPTSTWAVVCRNYVSRFATEAQARAHLEVINSHVLPCKADHKIVYTNLPAGSRLERDSK